MRPGQPKGADPRGAAAAGSSLGTFLGFLCQCGAHRVCQGHRAMDIPYSTGALVLCKGNPVWVGQDISALGTKAQQVRALGSHCSCSSLECQRHPQHPQGTNTGSVGDQVSLGANGKRREEAQELQPFAVLETGGRFCQIPKWNNLAVCILPTLRATTADTAQGQDSGWRKRKSREGTWNHFFLQDSNEGGTSISSNAFHGGNVRTLLE